MKNRLSILLGVLIFLPQMGCFNSRTRNLKEYVIEKENGQIILAYKAFEDFLDSDRSWENYKIILLDAYPQVQEMATVGDTIFSFRSSGICCGPPMGSGDIMMGMASPIREPGAM